MAALSEQQLLFKSLSQQWPAKTKVKNGFSLLNTGMIVESSPSQGSRC